MRRRELLVGEVPSVRLADLAYARGGRAKLRADGRCEIVIESAAAAHRFEVELVEVATRMGGTRSYLRCPHCGGRTLRLHFDPTQATLRCRADWQRLRYASQRPYRPVDRRQRAAEAQGGATTGS